MGGKLYTYQAGTSTPQATYTDSTGSTPNANPVVLDANGEASVWADPTLSYKFILQDSNGVQQWTVDNVIGLLTNNSVGTSSLQDLSVTAAKIAALAVDSTKLASDASIDANRAVTTNSIKDGAVTSGKKRASITSKTANYTVTTNDEVILVSASGGAFTLTLPTVAAATGMIIVVKRTDSTPANQVTVTDGGSFTKKLWTINETWRLTYDGSSWQVLDHKTKTPVTTYAMTIGAATTAPTKGTTTVDRATWCRDGEHMVLTYNLTQSTGGTSGSGIYKFPIANSANWSIDSTKTIIDNLVYASCCGDLKLYDAAGGGHMTGVVGAYDTTNLYLIAGNHINDPNAVSSTFVGLTGSTTNINYVARVAITGWEE